MHLGLLLNCFQAVSRILLLPIHHSLNPIHHRKLRRGLLRIGRLT